MFRCTTVLFSSQIQRLPFLSSSNLALDTLRGSDESIGFEDILNGQGVILLHCYRHKWPNDIDIFIFNTVSDFCLYTDPAQSEVMGEPHVMVEYKLGLL